MEYLYHLYLVFYWNKVQVHHLEILKHFVLSVVFSPYFWLLFIFLILLFLPFKFIILCDSIYLFYCPLFIIICLQVIYHFKYVTRKSLPSACHSFVWIYISIWCLFFPIDIFLLPFSFLGSWIYGDTLLLYSWSTALNKFCKIKKVTILSCVLEDIFTGYRNLGWYFVLLQ